MELGDCMTYAGLVVGLTSLWVYVGRHRSFPFLANAMFFPTIISLFFVESYSEFYMQTVGVKGIYPSVLYSVIAVVFVYAVVWSCVGLNLLLGWGTWIPASPNAAIHGHNSIEWQGFLRAAGEEIGWRCYLLPCLMSNLSPFSALLISGLVWGLFHVAVMVLLVNRLQPPRPYLTVTVQCLSVAICAFPIGWMSIKAGYSIWPSTVMHFVWNRVNPQILGSIYTQESGRIAGEQWLINGEGLAGCLVMSMFSVAALWNLS